MYDEIIILSKHFPFNQGETPAESFLENEISCIANKAKKINIFAFDAKVDAKITCDLPENAEAFAMLNCNLKYQKIKSFLKGLKFLFKKEEEISREYKKLNSFKKKMLLLYFAGKSEIKYEFIKSKIENPHGKKILIYNYWFFDSARSAVKLKQDYLKTNDVSCYSRAHGYDLYEYVNSCNYLPMREWLLENIDYVFTCSNYGREYLAKKFDNYKDKIKTAFLGTKDYGVQKGDPDIPTIISCSRLIPLKRVDRIIEALKIIDTQGIKLNWIHYGDGVLFDTLNSKTADFKNIGVEFKGNIPNTLLLELYKNDYYSCFVNVSETEGVPISIMEATSFGIPIIATDVGGTSDVVKDKINGYLLDADFTNQELAECILSVITMEKTDYQKLRDNARRVWEEEFEFNSNSEKLFEVVSKKGL